MVLIRLIMLLLVAWIGWRLYRVLTGAGLGRGEAAPPVEDMVRCAHCGVHVPRHTALQHAAGWYCCEAHRAEHLSRQ